MKKIKNKKLILSVIGGLVASTAIIGTVSFFVSFDEAVNVFKSGNISIYLSEPKYPGNSSPEVTSITHNTVIDKDPQITKETLNKSRKIILK